MQNQFFEKKIKSFVTFSTRWKGARGEVFELTQSHKTLRIRLTKDSSSKSLVVACIEPEHMIGPFTWANSNLKLSVFKLEENDLGFLLADERVGLRITCGAIEFKEYE